MGLWDDIKEFFGFGEDPRGDVRYNAEIRSRSQAEEDFFVDVAYEDYDAIKTYGTYGGVGAMWGEHQKAEFDAFVRHFRKKKPRVTLWVIKNNAAFKTVSRRRFGPAPPPIKYPKKET